MFKRIEHGKTRLVFENPENEWPVRITCKRVADGNLKITLTGPDSAGDAPKVVIYDLRLQGVD